MIRVRFLSVRILAAALVLPVAAPLVGCGGDSGDQAVETEEMQQSLEDITSNYGEQYSQEYGGRRPGQ